MGNLIGLKKAFLSQFLVSVISLSVLSTLIVYQAVNEIDSLLRANLSELFLQTIITIISIIFLAISLAANTQQITMSLFWIFHLIFFGLTGFLSLVDSNPYYLTDIARQNGFLKSSIFILIAELAAGLGQLFAMQKFSGSRLPVASQNSLNRDNLIKRVKIVFVIYIVLFPFALASLGGFSFLTRTVRYSQNQIELPLYLESISTTLIQVPPLICALTLLHTDRKSFKLKFLCWILICWVVILSNPLANARQTTLFLILPLCYFFLKNRRTLTKVFVFSLILFLLYGANMVDRFSGSVSKGQFVVMSRSGDFDAFSQLANGITQVDRGDFPYFRQILGSVFFYLPRSIWQSKPRDTGVEIANLMGLRFQNLSSPWILEAYANLRIPGIVVASLFLSYFLAKRELLSSSHLRSLLVSSLFFGALFIILRGSLLQATGKVLFSLTLIYFVSRTPKGWSRLKN